MDHMCAVGGCDVVIADNKKAKPGFYHPRYIARSDGKVKIVLSRMKTNEDKTKCLQKLEAEKRRAQTKRANARFNHEHPDVVQRAMQERLDTQGSKAALRIQAAAAERKRVYEEQKAQSNQLHRFYYSHWVKP
jgi:hypothetical protein